MLPAGYFRLHAVSYTHLDVYKRQDNMVQAVNEVLSLLETNLQQLRNLEHNISSMELEGYDYDFIKEALNYINSIAGTEDSNCLLYTSRCV